jgi:pimeloyl-ACP methyl ester carboxylesterase
MIVRWLLVGADASPNLVRLVQKVIVSVPPTLMASRTQEVLHCDVRDVLQQNTLPTLYLRAARDKIVRAGALREILELQPQAKVEKLDGPHFLLQREPEAAARIIEAFLEKCMDE